MFTRFPLVDRMDRMVSPIVRRGLLLFPFALFAGCNTVVLNPSGDIAAQQGYLLIISTALMLLIIVPVIWIGVFTFVYLMGVLP
jgi:cytochrome o ubiquinol oxidase subunit 2